MVLFIGLLDHNREGEIVFLYLPRTPIPDSELAPIERMSHLANLYLKDTQVTDAAMVCLKGFTKLTELCLRGTQVAAAVRVHLAGLTNRKGFPLSAQISDTGVTDIKNALPNCVIAPEPIFRARRSVSDAWLPSHVHTRYVFSAAFSQPTRDTDQR